MSIRLNFFFFKGEDFKGFEAEKKCSKKPVIAQQNSSKGKKRQQSDLVNCVCF